ncbi:hypothetical protein BDZ94DRAFT_1237555 [Collybia nuda]|uniref:Uncharacterized protein n=1 Tax=Collybia nuda TaxID=64659 RepID=A0A9P5Y2L6_9AGAR|nr:hypothetical protein BDZ94DRAFT_1237555 [Collybia nuda]
MPVLPTTQIRVCLFILLVLSALLHPSSALPILSINPVKCRLADFKTVIFFFLANYASHAFTVPSVPGGNLQWSVYMKLGSIFYPFVGLMRSTALFSNHWKQRGRGSIGNAIAQGAVMVAMRSPDWQPAEHWEHVLIGFPENFKPPEDSSSSAELPTSKIKLKVVYSQNETKSSGPLFSIEKKLDPTELDIHGEYKLPNGYHWVVPSITELNDLAAFLEQPEDIQVARSRSWLKGIIALGQLVFSSITIYQARGDQLVRYGYAAFGLSVFPYTLMSLVNLIVTAIIGEYSHLSILRTAVSDEAKQRTGGRISGEVGTLRTIPELSDEKPAATNKDSDNVANAIPELDESRSIEASTSWEREERTQKQLKRRFATAISRVETKGGRSILILKIDGITSRFLLVHDSNEEDDRTLYVSASNNESKTEVKSDSPFNSGNLRMGIVSPVGTITLTLLHVLPHIFIFLLTKYQNGHSTHAERAWMMSWLVFDQFLAQMGFFLGDTRSMMTIPLYWTIMLYICTLAYAVPAIGGFVMVGKMLLEFSPCAISE